MIFHAEWIVFQGAIMTNIFDTHAHYTDSRFDPDRAKVLQNLPGRGVALALCCGTSLPDSRAALALAGEHPFLYAACGVHPHEAAGFGAQEAEELRALLRDPRCVALGEIGLDYHYDFSPREQQREAFRRQLALALALNLPVVVHDREAHEDALLALREAKTGAAGQSLRGVMHCFSGSWELAQDILKLGFYLGFGGAVTFKNARKPLAVAALCPLDRLLLETDAPYMTPEPCRGQRCESPHIALTAEKIAAARGMDAQELTDICNENGRRLFQL
ncbi:MAG: TatD family hydrolase [Oscillospiraceae bacterium]|jgi:TatD DNase family protein|nr:TatD family hydrolase [Oscillospiraceae bacterium]